MDLTTEKKLKLHEPTTWMHAEEIMGVFSALKKRAPNATLALLSARMRAK